MTAGNLDHRGTTYVDRRLVGLSTVFLSCGLVAGVAGTAVGFVALAGGWRRYLATRPEPLRVAAQRRLQQARTATVAGLSAWRTHGHRTASTPSPAGS